MHRTIETATAGLLQQLKERGTHAETILNYQIVCNAIIGYCRQHETLGHYSSNLLQKYLEHNEQRLKNGEMSRGYAQFQRRTVRLLEEYAETGLANFSYALRKKRYIPTWQHDILISRILDDSELTASSRNVIDPPVRHFFCFIEERNVEVANLTDDMFFAFMDSVSEANKGSIGRTFRALRLVSDFLKENGLADLKADLSMLKIKSAPIKIIAPYSQDEIRRIVEVIDSSTPTGMRDKAILLLAFETGLRAIDITKLKLSDIEWKNAEMCVAQSKTKAPIVLTLNGFVMNAIADYILQARPKCDIPEIFLTIRAPYRQLDGASSIRSQFEIYAQKADVEKKPGRSFHSIRRTFATEMSLAGVPLPTISQMLGHKDIEQGKPYLTYDKEHISHCSIDFAEVPITCGMYASVKTPAFAVSWTGGGKNEF
jgi:site-specific recombinase XerD